MTEIILQALLLNVSLCLDAFAAGIAYGAEKIKIPFVSLMIINFICSAFLAVSLLAGSFFGSVIPEGITAWISFALLLLIGLIKLIGFFNTCRDPEKADKDRSRHISAGEAAALAVALSIDGLAVGFGAGLAAAGIWWIIGISLLANVAALKGGQFLGARIAARTKIDLGFLAGLLLILLAVMKVV